MTTYSLGDGTPRIDDSAYVADSTIVIGQAVLAWDASVGHQAMLHGCSAGEGTLIDVQAVMLNGESIGCNCLVGSGDLVTDRIVFPDNSLIVGARAKVLQELTEAEVVALRLNAAEYMDRGRRFRSQIKGIS